MMNDFFYLVCKTSSIDNTYRLSKVRIYKFTHFNLNQFRQTLNGHMRYLLFCSTQYKLHSLSYNFNHIVYTRFHSYLYVRLNRTRLSEIPRGFPLTIFDVWSERGTSQAKQYGSPLKIVIKHWRKELHYIIQYVPIAMFIQF